KIESITIPGSIKEIG
ncbi:hypothetical protein, partial [Metamycoplasma hominis]